MRLQDRRLRVRQTIDDIEPIRLVPVLHVKRADLLGQAVFGSLAVARCFSLLGMKFVRDEESHCSASNGSMSSKLRQLVDQHFLVLGVIHRDLNQV